MKFKPLYYIVVASTIDGFISFDEDSLPDWTSKEDKKHLKKMENKADVLLFSRKTYELAKKFVKKKKCIVLTSKVKNFFEENKFLTWLNPKEASLESYVSSKGYKKICVLGGRGAYDFAIKKNLVKEIYLTIEPIILGKGISMFSTCFKKKFKLVSVKKLNNKGSILLHYSKL
ncbi:MAG: dihydrofolate reductase [Candidatus Diapherotrites archaeon]